MLLLLLTGLQISRMYPTKSFWVKRNILSALMVVVNVNNGLPSFENLLEVLIQNPHQRIPIPS